MNVDLVAELSGAPIISTDDLEGDVEAVIDEIGKSGQPAVITKRGRMVAVISPLNPGNAETAALARSPEIKKSLALQEERMARGEVFTRTLDDVAEMLKRGREPGCTE